MQPRQRRVRLTSSVLLLSLAASCADDEGSASAPAAAACGAAQNQSRGGVSVVNDPCALDQEVVRTKEDVAIEPTVALAPPGFLPATVPVATLTLVATVKGPVVRGVALQAVGITLKGSSAVISYMQAGEARAGAIDSIRLSDAERPELISRATFENADILAADYDESNLWFVGGVEDPMAPSPAFLRAMRLMGGRLDLDESASVSLPSYAGTGIAVSSKKSIYVTSGSSGAFATFQYSKGMFTKLLESPVHDGRGLALDGDRIAVVGGTPGTLYVFDDGVAAPRAKHAFPGADIPEARSGVDVAGGKAFVAAGAGGLQILSLATGARLGSLAPPDAAALGLEPGTTTTNGVSVDGDLVFLCNGGAGIYVAQGAEPFAKSGAEVAQSLTLLGQLKLGRSANHVAFRGNYLIVAAGSAGVQLIRVDRPK